MTLDELQWMTELFRTKNMSKAVEKLYISQPALSQCLQRVERQLGFKLFTRSNKGLTPTEKGELFYRAALQITETYQEFLTQVSLLDQTTLTSIRIGLPPYISMLCSADLLRSLQDAYPETEFSVCEAQAGEMKEMIRSGQLQIMTITEPTVVEKTVAYPYGNVDSAIFLRKGSPAAQHAYTQNGLPYLDPVYLAEEPITMTYTGQSSRELAEAIFRECGIQPRLIQETRHMSTLYNYAREGITSAIGLCSPSIRELDRETHLIYQIPETYRLSRPQTVLHIRSEIDKRIPRPMLQIIKDVLRAAYGVDLRGTER